MHSTFGLRGIGSGTVFNPLGSVEIQVDSERVEEAQKLLADIEEYPNEEEADDIDA